MHTASSLDKRILQKSSFEELEYSSEHKYFTLLWNHTKTEILMCVLLLVSLVQKSSFWVLLWSSVCKNVPSDFVLPKHLLFICQNRANKTNTALSISIIPLIKAIFGLSGLEFCQNLQICMPNLVMLITHFGQKFKNPPPKCPSRNVNMNFWTFLCTTLILRLFICWGSEPNESLRNFIKFCFYQPRRGMVMQNCRSKKGRVMVFIYPW